MAITPEEPGPPRRRKVTVYVTSHNYGRYLRQALDSVIEQSMDDWELFIVNDGSTDDTQEIAEEYAARDPGRIEVIRHSEAMGLRRCANEVIDRSRGQYLIRLDADDYFDESALFILSNHLDSHPEIGLVYPNWTYVAEDGSFMGVERRKKVGKEAKVLDLPAHGACTMVRRRVIKSVGGYDPQFVSQDGHELWLKVLHRYRVGNVSTPLFFYRQHGSSMSRDERRLLNARQKIKRGLAARHEGHVKPRIVAVVPAKNTYSNLPNIVLEPIAGKPLIDHTLDEAEASGLFDGIYVSSDDPAVVRHCSGRPGVVAEVRDPELSGPRSTLAEVVSAAVETLEASHDIHPDVIVLLSLHSPLRRAEHIQKAIDTLTLYDVDNVISTYEDFELHFVHGPQGLEPLNRGMVEMLRYEREALYVDNGAVHVFWRDFVDDRNLYEGRIGHIVMPRQDSHQIKSAEDMRLVESLLKHREPSKKS